MNRILLKEFSLLLLLVFATGSLIAQTASEQDSNKVVKIVRVDTPPVIDGKIDEAVWQQAEVLTEFHQTRPGNGAPPSDPTEVYLLYDDNAIYVAARMYDSEPDRIAAPTVRHGEGLGSDDRIVIIFDPYNSGRGAFRFETNANGVRHDALYDSASSFESAWTAIYESAASYFDKGWEAEMAIPFKSLSFDPNIDSWGFNFGRGIRRRGEEIAWVSRNRSYNASILGTVTGLTGMDQGMGLDVVPSISVNRQKIYDPTNNDWNFEPSLDIFYKFTPSLTASLTVNTDFSATEVDDRQVNLTRFNLFFPEKRDFFLNDSDLFTFGRIGETGNDATSRSTDNNGRPFFSRRLGLGRSGQPVDLQVGGKLAGRIGRYNLGMLTMRQDGFQTVDATNIFVGRVSANVLDESTVGMMLTSGDPNSNNTNLMGGVDFRYLNTRLPCGRVLEADAWYQQSDTEGLDGNDAAFGMGIRMPNNTGARGGIQYKQIEENFNPALGFVSRSNIKDITVDGGYTWYPKNSYFQEIFTGVDVERISLLGNGGLQSQVILGRIVEIQNNTRDSFNIHYTHTKEVITAPFSIYEDINKEIIVPTGTYNFGETSATLSTGSQRDLVGELTVSYGDFYDGTRTNLAGGLTWIQSRYFTMSASYDWNDISIPQGDFITRLARISTEVTFSPTLYWINLVQYDNVSEVIGLNARLVWIPKAGQEGLIVFNHSWQDEDKDNGFRSRLSDINVKLSYTFRF
jgi:hypothetical protein